MRFRLKPGRMEQARIGPLTVILAYDGFGTEDLIVSLRWHSDEAEKKDERAG